MTDLERRRAEIAEIKAELADLHRQLEAAEKREAATIAAGVRKVQKTVSVPMFRKARGRDAYVLNSPTAA